LDVDFAILEFGCDMPSEGHIEVGGDFLAERFGVEGEDFEIGELTDVGREKDFVYVGFELGRQIHFHVVVLVGRRVLRLWAFYEEQRSHLQQRFDQLIQPKH
jgi:hypothetical protein